MVKSLQRTMKWLRDDGWLVGKVETPWNQWSRKRADLFGMLDAIGVRGKEVIGIQACSTGELPAHERKIRSSPHFGTWCVASKILLVGWSQKVARNKDGTKAKKKKWVSKSFYVLP